MGGCDWVLLEVSGCGWVGKMVKAQCTQQFLLNTLLSSLIFLPKLELNPQTDILK